MGRMCATKRPDDEGSDGPRPAGYRRPLCQRSCRARIGFKKRLEIGVRGSGRGATVAAGEFSVDRHLARLERVQRHRSVDLRTRWPRDLAIGLEAITGRRRLHCRQSPSRRPVTFPSRHNRRRLPASDRPLLKYNSPFSNDHKDVNFASPIGSPLVLKALVRLTSA